MLSNKITILIINYKAMQEIIKDIQDGRQFENWVKARTERQAVDFALDLTADNLDTDLKGLEVLEVEQYA
jgi:hypothetical protein